MRIQLDECMPRKLKRELPGHDVRPIHPLVRTSPRSSTSTDPDSATADDDEVVELVTVLCEDVIQLRGP